MSENLRFAFRRAPLARGIALAFGMGACASASALNWQLGGVGVDLNTRATSGVEMRVQGADPTYIGIANGGKAYSINVDDGELSFPRAGDLVAAPQKINSALTLTYKDFGIFARGYYDYDPVLQNQTYFNPRNYGPGKEYGIDSFDARQKNNRDHLGHASSILDLYAYGSEDLWGHSLSVKVGKQIVNWGESTLVLNGLNSLVSLDANKARLPGAEISEFVIPVPQVFASLNLAEDTSIEGFYQWKFSPTLPDAAGSFYPIPDQDFAGLGGVAGDLSFGRANELSLAGANCPGGNNTLTPTTCVPYGGTLPRGSDRMPRGGGQYGGAFRFVIPQLHETEVALYAANYHERLPVFSTTSASNVLVSAATASYFAEYPEDVHMYGFSFNTTLPWGVAFQGEYSYKPNQPFQLSSVESELATLGAPSQLDPNAAQTLGGQYIRGWRRKEISQLDFGFTKVLGGSNWFRWDQLVIIAEVAGDRVHNLENTAALAYEGPSTWQPNNAGESALFNVPQQQGGYPTANSWGYKVLFRSTYNNALIGGLTLEPGLRFDHDVQGITPLPLDNFIKNSRMLTPTVGWRYLSNLTGEVGYSTFFGGGQTNLLRDRDYVETYVRYSF
ncbi:MAG: DUF1302 domain-containing protein [Nevskia sp.]|nr:DUF1302 domain-containing protein [Nevskia sp.]